MCSVTCDVVRKKRKMRILAVCICLVVVVGCARVQPQRIEPRPTIQVDFCEDEGVSVNATDVRFGDLVQTVIGKMAEMESDTAAPSISMSSALANRVVSMNIQNEKSRRNLFAALETAGNFIMVAYEDGLHATFKEK